MQKYIDKFKKSSSPEPLGQFQPNLAQVSLDEEDSSLFKWRAHSFPRGDNYEITKIHYKFEKSSSPGPLGQFQPNLPQSMLGCGRFKFVQMKGSAFFQGEIITKLRKYIEQF